MRDPSSPPRWATAALSVIWPTSKAAPSKTIPWLVQARWYCTIAVIGSGATVGANAVVPNRMVVPAESLAIGVPAVIKPGKSSLKLIQLSSDEYVKNGHHYRKQLTRID